MVKTIGRPLIQVEQKDLRIVEEMAGRGATLDAIARVIGISPSTLDRWLVRDEVREAYEKGRAIATDQVASALFDLATLDRNVAAVIFWLKAQAGWKDKPQPEAEHHAQVVVYLPDNGRDDRATEKAPA